MMTHTSGLRVFRVLLVIFLLSAASGQLHRAKLSKNSVLDVCDVFNRGIIIDAGCVVWGIVYAFVLDGTGGGVSSSSELSLWTKM
jgi:hypothetical protein